MPHIVLECAEDILTRYSGEELIRQVHATILASQLFNEQDIKIRVRAYNDYAVGGKHEAFIHLFATIMPGRTVEQRAQLSKAVVVKLVEMFPDIKHITMSIDEFAKEAFFNRRML